MADKFNKLPGKCYDIGYKKKYITEKVLNILLENGVFGLKIYDNQTPFEIIAKLYNLKLI